MPCSIKIHQEAVSSRYSVAKTDKNPDGAFAQISFNVNANAKTTDTGNQGAIIFSASGYPEECE